LAPYLKRSLSEEDFVVLCGPDPPDTLGFQSDRIQILWNNSNQAWTDPGQHLHTDSDEVYIVLKGAMVLEVEDEHLTVSAGEICFVSSGTFHAIISVETPIQSLVIRSPASQDKVYRDGFWRVTTIGRKASEPQRCCADCR
jgi:mannose-6-phosphate isomerase-like protein (cupin superfamily)